MLDRDIKNTKEQIANTQRTLEVLTATLEQLEKKRLLTPEFQFMDPEVRFFVPSGYYTHYNSSPSFRELLLEVFHMKPEQYMSCKD